MEATEKIKVFAIIYHDEIISVLSFILFSMLIYLFCLTMISKKN